VALLGAGWLAGCMAASAGGMAGVAIGRAVLPLLAVPFAVLAAAIVARWRVGAALAWVGRNTLPIYVLHGIVLLPIVGLAALTPVPGNDAAGVVTAAVLPVLVAAAAVAGSLLAWLATRRFGWLYALPDAWWAGSADHGLVARRRDQPQVDHSAGLAVPRR
jgi:uncharacterized membrane protein YcfT